MAKAPILVTCPSGLTLEMRRWKLSDMEEWAESAESAGAGEALLATICQRSFVRIVDPGPYAFLEAGPANFDWQTIGKADVLWTLFRVRAASWPSDPATGRTGEHYLFDAVCKRHKTALVFQARVELNKLKARPLPAESAARMRDGKGLIHTTPDGITIVFRIPTLKQDEPLVKLLKKEKRGVRGSDLLAVQVDSITFPAGGPSAIHGDNNLAKKIRFFRDLDIEDLTPIRDAMSAAGMHVITKVDPTCPECGGVQTMQLPLGPSFFLPPDPSQETPEEEPEPEDPEPEEETNGDTESTSSEPSS